MDDGIALQSQVYNNIFIRNVDLSPMLVQVYSLS